MRRVVAVLLLIALAAPLVAAKAPHLSADMKAFLAATLPGAFGWRIVAYPPPTPTPEPTPTPAPPRVPPDWNSAWCDAVNAMAGQYNDILGMGRSASRDSSGSVGYYAGDAIWRGAEARIAIGRIPDWYVGDRVRRLAWLLVERGEKVISPLMTYYLDFPRARRAYNGYLALSRQLERASRRLRINGVTCKW